MRMVLVGMAVLLAVLVSGAAIAGQRPASFTETAADVEQAQQGAAAADAHHADAQAKAAAGRGRAAARASAARARGVQARADNRAAAGDAAQSPAAQDDHATGKDNAFGQTRKAEVHEAIAAGEKPAPAWQNPAHPTGGPAAAAPALPEQADPDAHRPGRPDAPGKPER